MLASKRDAVRMRRGGESQRLRLRHRAGRAGAGARRLQDLFRRRSFRGRRLRAVVPDHAVYVLNGVQPNTSPAYAELKVRPVIGSLVELAEWDGFCATNGWRGGAALHVDTGMNRLGLAPEEAAALAPRIRAENHGITLLMSHLACAELDGHPLNDKQIKLFREVRVLYRGIPSSLANSSGIFLGGTAHCDLVRPGAALYGVNPTPGHKNPMQPVVAVAGAHRACAHGRARRDRRLRRDLDRQAHDAAGGRDRRLCRRLPARARARPIRGRAPRRSLPARGVRSPDASPWT